MEELEEKMGYLAGDVLIASAFLSYTGPFLSNYRDDLVQKQWIAEVRIERHTCDLINTHTRDYQRHPNFFSVRAEWLQ